MFDEYESEKKEFLAAIREHDGYVDGILWRLIVCATMSYGLYYLWFLS